MMIDENERVILVSEDDEVIGDAPKLEVHRTGQLHRAFSVFVHDEEGRILLQRRAQSKYHSPGLWSNSCCGHPRPGEDTRDAATRRLREEMGITCELRHVKSFTYHATLGGELVEHELDHIFIGETEDGIVHDTAEVSEWTWQTPEEIEAWLAREPASFTAWFPAAFRALRE